MDQRHLKVDLIDDDVVDWPHSEVKIGVFCFKNLIFGAKINIVTTAFDYRSVLMERNIEIFLQHLLSLLPDNYNIGDPYNILKIFP